MTRRSARTQSKDARAIIDADMAEAEYQAQIVKLAKAQGWRVYHTYDSRRSEPGFPDLILVRGPTMLCMEVKREDGMMTPEQQGWLTALNQVRTVSAVPVRPSHWGIVAELLVKAAK